MAKKCAICGNLAPELRRRSIGDTEFTLLTDAGWSTVTMNGLPAPGMEDLWFCPNHDLPSEISLYPLDQAAVTLLLGIENAQDERVAVLQEGIRIGNAVIEAVARKTPGAVRVPIVPVKVVRAGEDFPVKSVFGTAPPLRQDMKDFVECARKRQEEAKTTDVNVPGDMGAYFDDVATRLLDMFGGVDSVAAAVRGGEVRLPPVDEIMRLVHEVVDVSEAIGKAANRGEVAPRVLFQSGGKNVAAFDINGLGNSLDIPEDLWAMMQRIYSERPCSAEPMTFEQFWLGHLSNTVVEVDIALQEALDAMYEVCNPEYTLRQCCGCPDCKNDE